MDVDFTCPPTILPRRANQLPATKPSTQPDPSQIAQKMAQLGPHQLTAREIEVGLGVAQNQQGVLVGSCVEEITNTELNLALAVSPSKDTVYFLWKKGWTVGEGSYTRVYGGYAIDLKSSAVEKIADMTIRKDGNGAIRGNALQKKVRSDYVMPAAPFHLWYTGETYDKERKASKVEKLFMPQKMMDGDLDDYTRHILKGGATKGEAQAAVCSLLEALIKASKGLEAIHAAGITHRDIKPANILVKNSGKEVKITDFGLAIEGSGKKGKCAGSERYLPSNRKDPDFVQNAATDVFALGVTIYQVLHHLPPRELRQGWNAEARQEVLSFVDETAKKDPTKRPTAQQVTKKLEEILKLQKSG